MNFLLEVKSYFFTTDGTYPKASIRAQENYLFALMACELENSGHSDALVLTQAFYDGVNQNTEQQYFMEEDLDTQKLILAEKIDVTRLSDLVLTRISAMNLKQQNQQDVEIVFYVLAHLGLGEIPKGIPEDQFYPEYAHLKKAIDRKDDLEIYFWVTKINDLYLVPKGYAAIVESIDRTNATAEEKQKFGDVYFLSPVVIQQAREAHNYFNIHSPENGLSYTNHYYIVKSQTRLELYKKYYLSKGIEPRNLKLNLSHAMAKGFSDYVESTGFENTFWGIVISEESYSNTINHFGLRLVKYYNEKEVFSPFDNWLIESKFTTAIKESKGNDSRESVIHQHFLHEYGHMQAHYHQVVARHQNNPVYDEIYAQMYAIAYHEDFLFSLYSSLEYFLYLDEDEKIHLSVFQDQDAGEEGYRVQTRHGACNSYYFLQFARDERFWNGNPPLKNEETFVTVYERDPEEFHTLMLQIRDEIDKGIDEYGLDEFRKATAGKYLKDFH